MTRKIRNPGKKSALIAGMLAAPMLGAPAGAADYLKTPLPAASTVSHDAKHPTDALPVAGALAKTSSGPASLVLMKDFSKASPNLVDVAGVDQGHTVYRNAQGQFFYLDPMTGDMKFLTGGHTCCKTTDKVTLLGLDTNGHTIQQNAKGEKFYLDATGNIMDVTVTK